MSASSASKTAAKRSAPPSSDYDEWHHAGINDQYEEIVWSRSDALKELTKKFNEFWPALWEHVTTPELINLVISPVGVAMNMAMPSFGADGGTESTFEGAIRIPRFKYQARIAYQAMVDYLRTSRAVGFRVAIGMFMPHTIEPRFEFIEATTRAFRSPVQRLDFTNLAIAAKTINKWCETMTGRNVTNIISEADIQGNPCIVLVSAVYSKVMWAKKFRVSEPKNLPFYVNLTHEINVPTMVTDGVFSCGHIKQADANFVRIPLKVEDIAYPMSMFVILPNQRDGFYKLVQNFSKIEIAKLYTDGENKNVHIQLPKFKVESQYDLEEPLTGMNLGRMFDPCGSSNFKKLIDDAPKLFISKAIHKTVVIIDPEDGGIPDSSSTPPPSATSFVANHPFYACVIAEIENKVNILTIRYCGKE